VAGGTIGDRDGDRLGVLVGLARHRRRHAHASNRDDRAGGGGIAVRGQGRRIDACSRHAGPARVRVGDRDVQRTRAPGVGIDAREADRRVLAVDAEGLGTPEPAVDAGRAAGTDAQGMKAIVGVVAGARIELAGDVDGLGSVAGQRSAVPVDGEEPRAPGHVDDKGDGEGGQRAGGSIRYTTRRGIPFDILLTHHAADAAAGDGGVVDRLVGSVGHLHDAVVDQVDLGLFLPELHADLDRVAAHRRDRQSVGVDGDRPAGDVGDSPCR